MYTDNNIICILLFVIKFQNIYYQFFVFCFQFNLDKCHFLLDLDVGTETALEPNYSRLNHHFTIVKSSTFLDARKWVQNFYSYIYNVLIVNNENYIWYYYVTDRIHSSELSTFHLYLISFVYMAHIIYYKVISLNPCFCHQSRGIPSFLKQRTEFWHSIR